MAKYHYQEHGIGYAINGFLRPWRPQFPIIVSWVKRGSKVLDAGCGDGILGSKLIKERKCIVYGIDLDETGVKKAKTQGIKAQIRDLDEGLPYSDRTFDYVICNEVLVFMKKPDFVISETLRVGKNVIVGFANFGFWFYRLQLLLGRFPQLSLYGHQWWETQTIKFFSIADFFSLPTMKQARIKRMNCINWRNREVSFLAKINPNLFGRSCILELSQK